MLLKKKKSQIQDAGVISYIQTLLKFNILKGICIIVILELEKEWPNKKLLPSILFSFFVFILGIDYCTLTSVH